MARLGLGRASPRAFSVLCSSAFVNLAALAVLALSLRAGVGSLGSLLPEIRADLDLSPSCVSLLTTLPTLFFAVIGLGAGRLVARTGIHVATATLLLTLAVGLVLRAVSGSAVAFLAATALTMAAAAVGNVVLPSLAKLHFPRHLVAVSSMYSVAISLGATISAFAAVPMSRHFDGWRAGIGVWAALPLLSLLLWMPATLRVGRRDSRSSDVAGVCYPHTAASPRLRWALAACFGAQAAQAYVQFGWWSDIFVDSGGSLGRAGALLGVISGIGIPISLCLPYLMRRVRRPSSLPVGFAGVTAVGWLGVAIAPLAFGGLLWAVLLGVGAGVFTWTLIMIGLRSPTPVAAVRLSSFTQGVGYLIASAATFASGMLHTATGSWAYSFGLVILLAVGIGVSGVVVARGGSGGSNDGDGGRQVLVPGRSRAREHRS